MRQCEVLQWIQEPYDYKWQCKGYVSLYQAKITHKTKIVVWIHSLSSDWHVLNWWTCVKEYYGVTFSLLGPSWRLLTTWNIMERLVFENDYMVSLYVCEIITIFRRKCSFLLWIMKSIYLSTGTILSYACMPFWQHCDKVNRFYDISTSIFYAFKWIAPQ